jgi:hypothetical protein
MDNAETYRPAPGDLVSHWHSRRELAVAPAAELERVED